VVDDEEMLRKMARLTLKRYGYAVLEAQNGEEALRVLAAAPSRPDVVLLDLNMPVLGGDELMPILSANYPGLRIVVSSGYPEEETRKVMPSISLIRFLQKPYTGLHCTRKIQQALVERL
jgi:CheY-like chemotaxis protein